MSRTQAILDTVDAVRPTSRKQLIIQIILRYDLCGSVNWRREVSQAFIRGLIFYRDNTIIRANYG